MCVGIHAHAPLTERVQDASVLAGKEDAGRSVLLVRLKVEKTIAH
jgi:hypothetical protein